jgi:Lon protease-like protein
MHKEWNEKKQARLDALRAAELTGTLDEADKAELAALIESLETEERERLAPALAQMQAEQATLRQRVQESEAENEQLVTLAAQQEQLLADELKLAEDPHRRRQDLYKRIVQRLRS